MFFSVKLNIALLLAGVAALSEISVGELKLENSPTLSASENIIAENAVNPANSRCGYDDLIKERGHRKKRFTFLASKWQEWNSGVRNTLLWT